jgi:hypothetical protein
MRRLVKTGDDVYQFLDEFVAGLQYVGLMWG